MTCVQAAVNIDFALIVKAQLHSLCEVYGKFIIFSLFASDSLKCVLFIFSYKFIVIATFLSSFIKSVQLQHYIPSKLYYIFLML